MDPKEVLQPQLVHSWQSGNCPQGCQCNPLEGEHHWVSHMLLAAGPGKQELHRNKEERTPSSAMPCSTLAPPTQNLTLRPLIKKCLQGPAPVLQSRATWVDWELSGNTLVTGTLMRARGNIDVGYIILHILCSLRIL